jgi:hypothetical protein
MRIDEFPADAWICEQHTDQPWPHPNPDEPDGQCPGPGILRPMLAAASDGTQGRDYASARASELRKARAQRGSESTQDS